MGKFLIWSVILFLMCQLAIPMSVVGDSTNLKQLIIGGAGYGSIPLNTTCYMVLQGGQIQDGGWQTQEIQSAQIIAAPGTLSSFLVELNKAPGVGQWVRFTIRVNSISSPVEVLISDGATQNLNRNDIQTVVPGDVVNIQCTTSTGLPSGIWARWSSVFTSTNPYDSLLLQGSAITNPSNKAYYYLQGGSNASDNGFIVAAQTIPTDGILSNLYVVLSGAPSATGNMSKGYKLRIDVNNVVVTNGLYCAIMGANTRASDTINQVSVHAGDRACFYIQIVGSPERVSIHTGLRFTATNPYESLLLGGSSNAISTSTNKPKYNPAIGVRAVWGGVEANECLGAQGGFTLTKLYVWMSAAPGVGIAWDFRYRANKADTGLKAVISDTNQLGHDLTHVYYTKDFDDVDMMESFSGGTPATAHAHMSMVCNSLN